MVSWPPGGWTAALEEMALCEAFMWSLKVESNLSNEKKPGLLSSYIGIIVNHYKDPY